ncbi:MAG: prolipoprotein diacylglyceryl transferase [Bdellovibrio sp.]|nr:MAG: prolipoprotein diacylglyceryl transferase [Bdellovibrio sp.]
MLPFIKITSSFYIPTYTLIISLVYCFCLWYLIKRAKKKRYDIKITLDLALIFMIAGFVGARLFHVFYEAPQYYKVHPLDILKIWRGGFVFYGGAITIALSFIWFLKSKKQPLLYWADLWAPVLAIGYGLGRLACFFNGCCYGKVCSLPWAVHFPGTPHPELARHPTQLYATAWGLLNFALLITLESLKVKRKPGDLFFLWLFIHAIGRLMMEHFRDDDRGQFILNLSISSWISLGLIVLSLGYWIFYRRTQKNFIH